MPKIKKEQLPDEILSFLGHELFQIPVRQFMDDNCLLFDKQIPLGDEHKKIHAVYRKLVDTLLETFCKDAGVTYDEVMKAIENMRGIDAIKEVFQLMFEQIEASVSFDVFYKVMESRNLQIQQQVLAMIMSMTGGELPRCMTPGEERQARRSGAVIAPVRDEQDEQVMNEVLRKSRKEHEREMSRRKTDDREMEDTLEVSRLEAQMVSRSRREVEEGLSMLALIDEPEKRAASARKHARGRSGADAASDWMSSARAEGGGSYARAAEGDDTSEPDVMKKRAEFFKQQREKLLAIKKGEREKMLRRAEADGPERPCSARAARKAIDEPAQPSRHDKEDEKKMQLKLAIAEKLRQEVLNN